MTRGKFISLEGGEGVGKSTQAALIADVVRAKGIEVVVTREPGGTPGAEAIRALLMTGDEDRWSAKVEALLFAAARADHIEKVIGPALERGAWVVCDRFLDSTRAYQGGAGGVSDADILTLHRIGSGGLMPDRTILMSLPHAVASSRTSVRDEGKGDRFGDRASSFHGALVAAFEEIAADETERFRIVDASGNALEVRDRMMMALSDLF